MKALVRLTHASGSLRRPGNRRLKLHSVERKVPEEAEVPLLSLSLPPPEQREDTPAGTLTQVSHDAAQAECAANNASYLQANSALARR